MKRIHKFILSGALVLVVGIIAVAVNIPNTFVDGTPISASDMNQNFRVIQRDLNRNVVRLNPNGNGYGLAKGGMQFPNPNNTLANFVLDWHNNVARFRVGGSGEGGKNGFDFQTQGDRSLMKLNHDGSVYLADLYASGSVLANIAMRVYNRNNPSAALTLDFLNDVARFRVGGNGPGAANGFDFQTISNRSLMKLNYDGIVNVKDLHASNGLLADKFMRLYAADYGPSMYMDIKLLNSIVDFKSGGVLNGFDFTTSSGTTLRIRPSGISANNIRVDNILEFLERGSDGYSWVGNMYGVKRNGSATIIIGPNVDVGGSVTARSFITDGADLSEPFDITSTKQLEPGMVVSIDPKDPGKLQVSTEPYDRKVAGIISGAGGVKTGIILKQEDVGLDGEYPVALTGRVYAWADASHGAIEPGDLLTTSETPGYAMKVSDHTQAPGATIGKAMSSLDEGQGLVLVLVALQ